MAGFAVDTTMKNVHAVRRSLSDSFPAAGKAEEEAGESDEPELTASADLEDSR